jgi:hypothetical protein
LSAIASLLVDEDPELGAVAELQLAEDAGDVRLHGALGDDQPSRDLPIAGTDRDQTQDLAFPVDQPGDLRRDWSSACSVSAAAPQGTGAPLRVTAGGKPEQHACINSARIPTDYHSSPNAAVGLFTARRFAQALMRIIRT